MIVLIQGLPDSGKSLRAEKLTEELAKGKPMYYLATMQPYGEEGRLRVEKHRRMREGKGFVTLEWERDFPGHLLETKLEKEGVCLLECVTNLVGNELYDFLNKHGVEKYRQETLARQILYQILLLKKQLAHLVLVTNDFHGTEADYDEETKRYLALLHQVNRDLAAVVDRLDYLEEGEWKVHEAGA